uniref:NAD(P)-binding protein n=1 Tax=Panagrellus redivivus TaxID=6233 RepID=A0A7E4UUW7_PANRE
MSKTAIITGASSGLGLHIAKRLLRHGGYKLVLGARNPEKITRATSEINAEIPGLEKDVFQFWTLDLNNRDSITSFVARFKTDIPTGLDLLINNGGVMGAPHELAADGIELHFDTNYLGHYILTEALLDCLNENARILLISSGFYKNAQGVPTLSELTSLPAIKNFKPNQLYSLSKLANCLHAVELDAKLQSDESNPRLKSVKVFAIRPGFVRGTELGRHVNVVLRTLASPIIWAVSKDIEAGTDTMFHCATAPIETLESGKLYADKQLEEYASNVTPGAVEQLRSLTKELLKTSTASAGTE